MRPSGPIRDHPFVHTLDQWVEGVPVDCGRDWTNEAIRAAMDKGPHKSATSAASITLVAEEVDYQVKAGFCEVITWSSIADNPPRNLKISPLACIPQTNRRDRLILDLSFPVYRPQAVRKRKATAEILQPSVNDSTTSLSPKQPVQELGKVLPRIFDFMAAVPPNESIMFSKIDLSDGFWRMRVSASDRWNFAYVLPQPPGEPLRLVIPSALQMGWTESPGYFCAATETTRDVIQVLISNNVDMDAHPFESYMTPARPAKRQRLGATEWQMTGVFVDDFCLGAVENATGSLLRRISRAALHSIHATFPAPEVSGHTGGKDSISLKKLEKGDARWATSKELLGFLVDGDRRTVQLPQAKADGITKELRRILRKRTVAIKVFQKIVGKLRHAAIILPAAKSLFTPLNNAMKGDPVAVSLGKHSEVRATMLDFISLINDLAKRPTHISEIVPSDPHYIGHCDASGSGAGGVWFSGTRCMIPTVWRVQFPPDITAAVVSDSNPTGSLTNSDLEMAGVLLHHLVLETIIRTKHCHSATLCDNTPSVAWVTRMAAKSSSPVAHRLLRGLALRQRLNKTALPMIDFIAGLDNIWADEASRIAARIKLRPGSNLPSVSRVAPITDPEFLTHFNSKFPLPQNLSWRLAHPTPAMLSNVISTLRGQRLPMQQWMTKPESTVGTPGCNTWPSGDKHRTCPTCPNTTSRKSSWPSAPGFALDSSGKSGKLEPNLSRKPCVTWHRPLYWLDLPTPDAPPAQEN